MPKLKVAKIESCQSLKFPILKVAKVENELPSCKIAKLPSCKIAKLQNCQITKLQVPKLWTCEYTCSATCGAKKPLQVKPAMRVRTVQTVCFLLKWMDCQFFCLLT